jgi:hypothetical protein
LELAQPSGVSRHWAGVADRFHAHVLRTPLEVARAVAYVLGNFVVHAPRRGALGEEPAPRIPDAYGSAAPGASALLSPPRTWLLREGWRRAFCRNGGVSESAIAVVAPCKLY